MGIRLIGSALLFFKRLTRLRKLIGMRMYRKIAAALGLFCVILGMSLMYKHVKQNPKLDATVMGYINMADGLGSQGPELIKALKDQFKLDFRYTRKIKHVKVPKVIEKIVKQKANTWGKVVIYEDILWGPWDGSCINKLKGCPRKSIKLAYSMYEATKIPDEWVDILNKKFDGVLVPSKFLIKVYQDSGVRVPIFVLPLGLHLEAYLREPLKSGKNKEFVFGNLSAGSDRKNHEALVLAFAKAFGNDPSVKLVINARYSEKEVRNSLTKIISELNLNNIKFTQKSLKKTDYIKKFHEIDCYVSPSKGEGFSIQPREAMALGIPVIATNNTGQEDLCDSGLVESVKSLIKKPALNPWGDYYGYNFDCEVDDLALAMRNVRDNYDNYITQSQAARDWASQFLFKNLKDYYATVINPKAVILSNKNKIEKGCVYTTSRNLLNKYKVLFGDSVAETSNELVFSTIYETAEWGTNEDGKGYSGEGSLVKNALPYIKFLKDFIVENKIKSVVDLGCGDWTFTKTIDWSGVDYTGIDVVPSVLQNNKRLYSKPNVRFICADATKVKIPKADLLICKEVLQHLSDQDVKAILKQAKNYKYCLFTNDVDPLTRTSNNGDIESGAWRTIDLTKPPFNLNGNEVLSYDAHGNKKVVLLVRN